MTTSMKHVLSGILSFVAVLVAGGVSALTREALQAKNTLDTGVGLYSHSGTATFAGFLAFAVVLPQRFVCAQTHPQLLPKANSSHGSRAHLHVPESFPGRRSFLLIVSFNRFF